MAHSRGDARCPIKIDVRAPGPFGRCWVKSAFLPWVAPAQPVARQKASFDRSMMTQRIDCVLRTRRIKAATWAEQRRNRELVHPDDPHEKPDERQSNDVQHFLDGYAHAATLDIAVTKSFSNSALVAVAAGGSARTTTRDPGGSSLRCAATTWRSLRDT